MSSCTHTPFSTDSSEHAKSTRYKRTEENRRIAATQPSGRVPKNVEDLKVSPLTFPAPLILPGDELAEDGTYPPQSLRAWNNLSVRNPVTQDRRTIYLVAPPEISKEASFMQRWSEPKPQARSSSSTKSKQKSLQQPAIDDIFAFFQAFYHGMEVQITSHPWRFTPWNSDGGIEHEDLSSAVALETLDSAVRIRTRSSPDGCFANQLNLLDLLDACIESVPKDAYAMCLIVNQDMFEDEEDKFCCGRAYGGSRVAVVSTARYHPLLDDYHDLERSHAWPASHCALYMTAMCGKVLQKKSESSTNPTTNQSAMGAAIEAHTSLPSLEREKVTPQELQGLWLGRICKTAAHEVGHCLGIDHCVYYACLMQGTMNIGEDARQPPFLCPVDLAKYAAAAGCDVQGRYEALLQFCLARPDVHLFAAFAEWIRVRLMELHA